MALNMAEVSELVELLKVKLNIQNLPMGTPMMMPQATAESAPAAAGNPAQSQTVEKKEEKKEKTEFSLKLDSFNAADKLKVSFSSVMLRESADFFCRLSRRFGPSPDWV